MKTLLWILGGLWLLGKMAPAPAVSLVPDPGIAIPTYGPDASPLPPDDGLTHAAAMGLTPITLARPARPARPGTVVAL